MLSCYQKTQRASPLPQDMLFFQRYLQARYGRHQTHSVVNCQTGGLHPWLIHCYVCFVVLLYRLHFYPRRSRVIDAAGKQSGRDVFWVQRFTGNRHTKTITGFCFINLQWTKTEPLPIYMQRLLLPGKLCACFSIGGTAFAEGIRHGDVILFCVFFHGTVGGIAGRQFTLAYQPSGSEQFSTPFTSAFMPLVPQASPHHNFCLTKDRTSSMRKQFINNPPNELPELMLVLYFPQ